MIALVDIHKQYKTRYGHHTALDGVNLTVSPGEKIGILGSNGAGKSTLIRILSGAEHPTKGQVFRDMKISWPLAFGGAFQGGLTGMDNVRFVCRIYNADIDRVRHFVMNFSELDKFLNEPVKTYSTGMRARLAFALSMAIDFDCYLIDEIIAVGDRRFHEKCHDELFTKRHSKAMIIVSHDPHYIREHCDRACVLVKGKLHHYDSVNDAYVFFNKSLHDPSQ